jgi:hypothetical protein
MLQVISLAPLLIGGTPTLLPMLLPILLPGQNLLHNSEEEGIPVTEARQHVIQ